MSLSLDPTNYRDLLRAFLNEDLGVGDITTDSVVSAAQRARGELLAKANLVVAGVDLFTEVFRLLDADTETEIRLRDGAEAHPGDVVACVRGRARALLTGERVALNLVQRLSGIATLTRSFVQAVAGTGAEILDTRKTTPGLRALEKYAVRVGGGRSYRQDLGEAILIKDNHIRLAGGVRQALEAAQTAKGRSKWIEIEVTDIEELRDAVAQRPDIVLLDNMNPAQVREAVAETRKLDAGRAIRIEASGGITLGNVREYAEAGADLISVGALTHSAAAVDLSFEIEPIRS